MKKWILALVALGAILIVSVYVFIPARIQVTAALKIPSSENGTVRYLLEKPWDKWWNYKDSLSSYFSSSGNRYLCNGDTFILGKMYHNSADVEIINAGDKVPSRFVAVSLMVDTTGVQWSLELAAGSNPFSRFSRYRQASAIKKNLDLVLRHFASFMALPENVYGLSLARTSITDTLLVSTKQEFSTLPGTEAVYAQVKQLQDYAAHSGAMQTGHPIFHITALDGHRYELMTALPVDKALPDQGRFAFKRMIPGSFIVSEVRGGEYTVDQAQQRLKQFFSDYRKTSMAIDFQMLVTDRLQTPDTSLWITRLYEPVY